MVKTTLKDLTMLLMLPFVGLNIVLDEGPQLIANMGLDALYHALRVSATSSNNCVVTFTVKRDGTWAITKTAAASWSVGAVFTGNWINPPSATIGDNYEVSFNNGSSYQALTSDRSTSVTANDTTFNDGSEVVDDSNTVIVRKVGTTSPTSSDSYALRAEDDFTNL